MPGSQIGRARRLRSERCEMTGDNVCTTNPTLGRGLSLAIQGAADLADTLDRCGGHAADLALALDERAGDHIAPFNADQADTGAARLAALRNAISGAAPPAPAAPGRVTFARPRYLPSDHSAHPRPAAYRAGASSVIIPAQRASRLIG